MRVAPRLIQTRLQPVAETPHIDERSSDAKAEGHGSDRAR